MADIIEYAVYLCSLFFLCIWAAECTRPGSSYEAFFASAFWLDVEKIR